MILFNKRFIKNLWELKKQQTIRFSCKQMWKVGNLHDLRVHALDKPFAQVQILAVYWKCLGDLTVAEIKADGFPDYVALEEELKRLYPYNNFTETTGCWIIKFHLIKKLNVAYWIKKIQGGKSDATGLKLGKLTIGQTRRYYLERRMAKTKEGTKCTT